MTWSVTADVTKFDEAAAFFRSKFPVTEQVATKLGTYAGPRAWTIAGVAQLDVVSDALASLQRAIEDGVPFDEWKVGIEDKLAASWGAPDAPRVQTIFRNATSQAYNAGRWRQMNEPAVRQYRPYLMFDGVADSRQSDICAAWDGTVRPIDDPVWDIAHPQMHHNCRSQLRSLREADAFDEGITAVVPEAQADEGFGSPPTETEWHPSAGDYDRQAFNEYQLKRQELERQVDRPRLDE